MKFGKRGLSDVVTTVLIILLVLAAVVIIWMVVKPFITKSAGTIDVTSKCVGIDVAVTECKETANGVYSVKFNNNGADKIKVKALMFNSDNTNSILSTDSKEINAFASDTMTGWPPGDGFNSATGAETSVKVVPVVKDESGADKNCDPVGAPVPCTPFVAS